MSEELTLSVPISDADLLEAVSIMRDRHFAALSLCNALAGAQSPCWLAIYQHGTKLFAEAKRRGLTIAEARR